jgi:hypothetical protein
MSSRQRLTFAAIAAAIAVVAVIVLVAAGGSDETPSKAGNTPQEMGGTATPEAADPGSTATPAATPKPKPKPTVIAVKGGQPSGGLAKIKAKQGEQVTFTVTSDQADDVHVHGYDIEKSVPAGGSARFSFPAKITGVFEVELHHSGAQIARLTVNP